MARRERDTERTDRAATATGGSDLNIEQRNLAEEGQEMVQEGGVYKEKNGTAEVIPFFVDFARATVRFAPVGRATEDEMRTSDFLNRYELVEKSAMAEATPEESQKAAEARLEKRETTDQLGRVIARDGKPV